MKYFALLAVAIVAYVECVPAHVGIVNTGASAVTSSRDGHGNYAFAYNEDHATGGTFRKESGGPGYQSGSYGLRDHDGRVRVVDYVADAHGYRASIKTNEPGVDPKQDPAATSINGGGYLAGPVAIAAAPVAIAAPVAYAAAPVAAYGVGAVGYGGAIGGYGGAIGYGAPSSYSVQTQHVAAPALAYAAGPAIGLGGKGYGGW